MVGRSQTDFAHAGRENFLKGRSMGAEDGLVSQGNGRAPKVAMQKSLKDDWFPWYCRRSLQ